MGKVLNNLNKQKENLEEEVFQISEEEDFDKDHDTEIKERMVPLLNRITPHEITDEIRFNIDNWKITMEELKTTINTTNQAKQTSILETIL